MFSDRAAVKTYIGFYLRTSELLTVGSYDSVSGTSLPAAVTGLDLMPSEVGLIPGTKQLSTSRKNTESALKVESKSSY